MLNNTEIVLESAITAGKNNENEKYVIPSNAELNKASKSILSKFDDVFRELAKWKWFMLFKGMDRNTFFWINNYDWRKS